MRENKKGTNLIQEYPVVSIITILVVALVSWNVVASYTDEEKGIGNSISGLDNSLECQFDKSKCDYSSSKGQLDIDSNVAQQNNRAPLDITVDESNFELINTDYKTKYSRLGSQLILEIEKVAENLDMDPLYLFAVIDFETGGTFSSSEKNRAGSGAVGLIQFMPDTANSLGTSSKELEKMDEYEQLEYVEKYFNQFNVNYDSLQSVYMAVLWPGGIEKPLNYIMFAKGDRYYNSNIGLDKNKDGYIIIAETLERVVDHYNS